MTARRRYTPAALGLLTLALVAAALADARTFNGLDVAALICCMAFLASAVKR